MADQQNDACALCGRKQALTFHHLIPRTCHGNKWFRKRFSREEMQRRGALLCRPCHRFVHERHEEKVLGREFNTLEALQNDAAVRDFAAWISRRG